ncbi:unannotated protein [freshwater metagenome]|uniref:Unannotated protein n=1 Tax=freshwater metagenome TaxID=449393 RepID=A0A6J7H3L3_9ZZZZ
MPLYAPRMDVRLDGLRALIAVVDEGSFTSAATVRGRSQATVSRSVAALERQVGGVLLDRSSRDLRPTPLGTRVIPAARRVLRAVDDLERAVVEGTTELRVGFAWSALGRHTGVVQRRWAQLFPGRRLVFEQVGSATAGLESGDVDVAVLRRQPDPAAFDGVLVGSEPRVVALADDHPLARRTGLALGDFDGVRIAIDAGTGTTTSGLWDGTGATVSTRPVHGVDEWLTVIASGEAVGVTPESTTAQYRRSGVVFRPLRGPAPVPVRIAWRRGDPPELLDAFVRLVTEAYADG